ncbi:hypothetical protein ACJJTC_004158 [Scirpophaga incertulas]
MADEKKERERLIKKRSGLKSKLTIFNNYLTLLDSCDELSAVQLLDLESRFKKFDAVYPIFDQLQSDIEMLSEDPADEIEEREQFENQFHSLAATARHLIGRSQHLTLRDGSVACVEDVTQGVLVFTH